jgi:PEP-CTERM motif
MAFACLNDQIVCDLGGVHHATAATCVSPFAVGPGSYNLQVFFVDINNSQAGLYFNVLTSGVTTHPTGAPAPGSLALLAAGLAGLAARARRRRRNA